MTATPAPTPAPTPAATPSSPPDPRLVVALAAGATAVALAVPTLSWPVTFDASLMDYVVQRIADGAVPYRDVWDMNLPVTYALHAAVLATVGTSALAWRLLDLLALLAGAVAVFRLAAPWGRPSAAVGAVGFALYHLGHGVWGVGERDFLGAVLGAWALVLLAGRDDADVPDRRSFLAGILLGLAAGIKPNELVLAVGAAVVVGRAGGAVLLGTGAVVAACVGWLASRGALEPFLDMWRAMMPVHTGLRVSNGELLKRLLFEAPAWLVPLGVVGLLVGPAKQVRRRRLLGLGLAYGLFHWAQQGKAWEYHAYPLAIVAWAAAVAAWADADRRWLRGLGWALVPAALLVQGAWGWVHLGDGHVERLTRNDAALAAALRPGDTVQILGDVGGGIQALVEQHRAQATPLVYDFHLYDRGDAPEVQAWRARFLGSLEQAAPDVVFVSVHSWPTNGFQRLDRWPELQAWLGEHYTVVEDEKAYRVLRRR